jgi:Transposase DDE domain
MHATQVLQKILRPVIARLDARNARNLLFAVEALLMGRRLTLMELARHFPGAERVRPPLKRLDRLLGNRDVQAVRTQLYQAAVAWLLRSKQPVLIVDWSELKSDGRFHLLRAAVAARGRTLTVYEEVHPEDRKNTPDVEAAFLARLQALLPLALCPILITDAGFRVAWFRAVEALGWHWVGRVRGTTRVCFRAKNKWFCGRRLHRSATPRARSLGEARLTESNPIGCRLVLLRRPRRGRHQRTRTGARVRNRYAEHMAARTREPWLLAVSTSLDHLSATRITRLYAKRMQIEQSFRDLKSHRYGCAFEDTLTRDPRRLEMLLLIHALASLVAWLEGLSIVTATPATTTTTSGQAFHSITWIGYERLRRQCARLSLPLPDAIGRLRQVLAVAA